MTLRACLARQFHTGLTLLPSACLPACVQPTIFSTHSQLTGALSMDIF